MKHLNTFVALGIIAVAVLLSQSLNVTTPETYIRGTLSKSVVYVVNDDETGGGTGFLLQNDNGRSYIVTNNHVCEHAQKDGMIKVKTDDKTIKRRVIDSSKDADLCVIEAGYDQSSLYMANHYEIGNKAYVMGHPYLNPSTFVNGELVAKQKIALIKYQITESSPPCDGPNQKAQMVPIFIFNSLMCIQEYDSIATTIPTHPGNSGSPLVDEYGQVIGVIFAGNSYTNWGYAVPLEDLRKFVNKY